jgi:uncharacterized protein YkwD
MSNSGSIAIQKSIVSTKGAQSTANKQKNSIFAIVTAARHNDETPPTFIRDPYTQINQDLRFSLRNTPTSYVQNTPIQSSFSSNQSTSLNSSSTIYSSTTPNSTNADSSELLTQEANPPNPNSVADSTAEQPSDNSLSINSDDNQTNQPNGADIQLPSFEQIPNPADLATEPNPMVPNPNNVPITNFEMRVIDLTNIARAERGLPALEVRADIIQSSRQSSYMMQEANIMEHGFRMGNAHRENIAMGQRSPEEVVRAWLNSPGHYANIMSNSKYIGVGDTSNNSGRIFWTMQTAS